MTGRGGGARAEDAFFELFHARADAGARVSSPVWSRMRILREFSSLAGFLSSLSSAMVVAVRVCLLIKLWRARSPARSRRLA